ncbi:DNA primase [Bacillus sp. 2205SS5-2]|uniref:DNA primase n=1 Tax=Bacillus sp. 2205SS5-2 TaxID=3109031 RepID=UPI0030066FD4
MTGRIPEEKVNEIRQSVDIVDIISDYVQLKKQGRNYFGLCPFHGESTPSFSVSPEKQIYHCFGCGAGGNAISFLMDTEGISFQETLIELAGRSGIQVELDIPSISNTKISKEQELMLEAHELLCKFYHHLLVNTKEGQDALEYLLLRGFTLETIKEYRIGWSLLSWDFTVKFLQKRDFPVELMENAGLLVKKVDENTYFDRFRGRIMFPIEDVKGKVIAFSGRALQDDSPKYLNSPETVLFNKSGILYNLHRARGQIKKLDQAILFEGFADVISASTADIKNGIATMGTSLTEQHIGMIRRMASSIVICYDGDSAGIQAAFRTAKMLTETGMNVRIAQVPEKLDPDDYIQKFGKKKFLENVIGASITFMAFKLVYFRMKKNLQDEGDRLKYIEEVLTEISYLDSFVERDLYLRQLSDEFDLSLEALVQQQKQIYFMQRKKDPSIGKKQQIALVEPKVNHRLFPAYQTAERHLIAHMLKDADVTYKIRELLAGEPFNIDEHQAIFTYLLAYYEEDNSPNTSSFLTFIPDEKLRRVITDIEMMSINNEASDQEIVDCVNSVLKHQKMLTIKDKENERREAERQNDVTKAVQIAMEIIQLQKSLHNK